MRQMLSQALVEAAQADERVLLLTGDHGYALFDAFRAACPDRFINAGVAEQNMVGVAAGLAAAGYRPIVYGLSSFVPVRVLEQIKLDVCYHELPVLFLGDGAGVVYSTLGSSHQSTEDISALRAVPNIEIFSPADAWELRATFDIALERGRPTYLRIGKADLGAVHSTPPSGWAVGDLLDVDIPDQKDASRSVALIATGSMVRAAMAVAPLLDARVSIYSAPFLKPLNDAQVVRVAREHDLVVTLEEHNAIGGLGSAVCEAAAAHGIGTPVHRIGIRDRYSAMAGSYAYLMREHGLDADTVLAEVTARLESLQPA